MNCVTSVYKPATLEAVCFPKLSQNIFIYRFMIYHEYNIYSCNFHNLRLPTNFLNRLRGSGDGIFAAARMDILMISSDFSPWSKPILPIMLFVKISL